MKIISACFVTISLFLTLELGAVFAHTDYSLPVPAEGKVTEALEKTVPLRFLPSHPLYSFITIKETISRFFKPSAKERAQFDLVLSGKRLKEAYLLLNEGKISSSGKALSRYGQRLKSMTKQFEKAKAQNQDIENLLGETAETFKHYEILLSAIEARWQESEDLYRFDESLDEAVSAFSETVEVLDRFKPGVADWFQITRNSSDLEELPAMEATPSQIIKEASPSSSPRRIIY